MAAAVSCEDWGKRLFFSKAGAADVSRCLKAGADLEARDKSNDTVLHNAVEYSSDPVVIATLLKAGADLDAKGYNGMSVLFKAAMYGNPDVIDLLLKAGADVNGRSINNCTALQGAASWNRNVEVINALLKAGARVNDRGHCSPLHAAAGGPQKDPEVITTLIKAGADVNGRDLRGRYGDTPLIEAATSVWPRPAIVTALVAAGADPMARNYKGKTALQLAKENEYDPAQRLLAAFSEEAVAAFKEKQRQADASARKRHIEARLRAARVSCEKWNTAGFFRNAGAADVSRCLKTDNHSARDQAGETPLHMTAKFSKAPEVVAAIAKAGADLNAQDKKGRTPLHTAAVFSKEPKVVAALIEAGADLTVRDKRGRTALEFGEKFSKTPAVVAVLRESAVAKKARIPAQSRDLEPRPASGQVSCENWNTPSFFRDANLSDLIRCLKTKDANARGGNGRTPLHYAAQGEKPALVTALAGAGADVNARDERGGWAPLHLAAWFSKTPSVVDALLAVGADPTAKDKAGKTPWDYAAQNAALKDTAPYRRLSEERSR